MEVAVEINPEVIERVVKKRTDPHWLFCRATWAKERARSARANGNQIFAEYAETFAAACILRARSLTTGVY